MAGIRIELDSAEVRSAIGQAVKAMRDPAPLLEWIKEYLLRVNKARFTTQLSPEGKAWQALSPRYLKRKRKNRNKILTLHGLLKNTLRGDIDATGLVVGTDRVYGAIHQFGSIKKPGTAGVGGRTISMPARPWLGTSKKDNEQILLKAQRYLQKALAKR